MAAAIGLLELKSIPVGLEAADAVLKRADVTLLQASPACPGKYVIIFTGDVGAVRTALEAGVQAGGAYVLTHHMISSIHPTVSTAIVGTVDAHDIQALGMVETISALTVIRAGDTAAKAADVTLLEIRVARGLGGKGFLLVTGDIAAVKSAVNAVKEELAETCEIISSCVIPNPHKDLISHI